MVRDRAPLNAAPADFETWLKRQLFIGVVFVEDKIVQFMLMSFMMMLSEDDDDDLGECDEINGFQKTHGSRRNGLNK